jgi:flagellar motor switch protein FliN/FliY
MGSQTLSQDELNLLLNDVMALQEDAPEPDSISAGALTENDKKILAGTVDLSQESNRKDVARFSGTADLPPREKVEQVAQQPDERKIMVQPVQFMSLDTGEFKKEGGGNKLELIYDVGLQMTVELGRTEKTLKEILEIGPGSIVGLDKLAGEPLDIMINGKLLARGEVIVIDENYGVRIKEIVSSRERIGGLKA